MIQITKQAVRRDEDDQRYLNCPCGQKLAVGRRAEDYQILYVCYCGIEYDSHGYVQAGPMFEGNTIYELTDLVERKLTEAKCL